MFQNARLQERCTFPYLEVIATTDIPAGTEIWMSYGPGYNYDEFMQPCGAGLLLHARDGGLLKSLRIRALTRLNGCGRVVG
jgi:hypothetical protein